MIDKKKQEFWDSRADLGETAGTNDFVLKRLEMALLTRYVAKDATVLDVGCGNGDALIRLATDKGCSGVGVDFSPEMVAQAKDRAKEKGLDERLRFVEGALPDLDDSLGKFDHVITERCLINLKDTEEHHAAFEALMRRLKRRGTYLMIESSVQGLARSNELRSRLDLEPIEPPWHNTFIDEEAVETWTTPDWVLEEVLPFSSTYHFLSRVVYAKVAEQRGETLHYDSDINMLALKLPIVGDFGPVRFWVWRNG